MLPRWQDACSGSKKSRMFPELSRRGTVVFVFKNFVDLSIFNCCIDQKNEATFLIWPIYRFLSVRVVS